MKFGRDQPLTMSVLKRDDWCCVACGFRLRCALSVHHTVPRAHGGVDSDANLATLCVNCHRVVHWLSIGKRLDGPEAEEARLALGNDAFRVIRSLADRIRSHCREIKKGGNVWRERGDTSRGQTPLAEALRLVGHRNRLSDVAQQLLMEVTAKILSHIPADVQPHCAFRVSSGHHFFSVNLGNILIYRTLGYPDGAKRPQNDVWFLWPEDVAPSVIPDWQEYKDDVEFTGGGRFGAIHCVNVDMTFVEALAMEHSDWDTFAQACRDVAGLSTAKAWVSNVSVDFDRLATADSELSD